MRRTVPGVLVLWLTAVFALPGADVETLIKQAKSKDSDERRNAFKDLGEVTGETRLVVPVLLVGLKDPDKYVRMFAAQALSKMEDLDSKKVLPVLSKMAGDRYEKKEVQEAVVAALGKLGTGAVDPLGRVLKDRDKEMSVRQRAAASLAIIGPAGARMSVPVLLDVVKEKGAKKGKKGPADLDGSIRVDAINALAKIASAKDENVVKMLEGLAAEKNKDKNFKATLKSALREIKARN